MAEGGQESHHLITSSGCGNSRTSAARTERDEEDTRDNPGELPTELRSLPVAKASPRNTLAPVATAGEAHGTSLYYFCNLLWIYKHFKTNS